MGLLCILTDGLLYPLPGLVTQSLVPVYTTITQLIITALSIAAVSDGPYPPRNLRNDRHSGVQKKQSSASSERSNPTSSVLDRPQQRGHQKIKNTGNWTLPPITCQCTVSPDSYTHLSPSRSSSCAVVRFSRPLSSI